MDNSHKYSLSILKGIDQNLLMQHIIKDSSIGVYAIDLKTHFVEISKEIAEILNTDKTLFANISEVLYLVHPDDMPIFQKMSDTITSGDFFVEPVCIRMIKRDNTFLWVNFSISVIKDDDGLPSKIVGTVSNYSKTMFTHEINKLTREGASDYYGYYDFNNKKAEFNSKFLELLGFSNSSDKTLDELFSRLADSEGKKITDSFLALRQNEEEFLKFQFVLSDKKGQARTFNFSGKVARDAKKVPYLTAGIINDVTEIEKSKKITKELLDIPNGYTYIYDMEADKIEISVRILEILPLKSNIFYDVIDTWSNVIHPDDREQFKNSYKDIVECKTNIHSLEYRVKNINGEYIWVAGRSTAISNEYGKPIILAGSVIEISTMGNYNKFLENKGYFDKLTNLPNRLHFIKDYENNSKTQEIKGFVININIDGFKNVNNLYGLLAGDSLLLEIGNIFSSLYDNEGELYHFGGDSFVFNLPDFDKNKTEKLIERIKNIDSRTINSKKLNFTLSIVAAEYNSSSINVDELLNNLGIAMAKIKRSGKNMHAFYDSADSIPYIKEARLEEALVESIKNDFVGFEVYYQPLINGKNNKCLGAEALLRFKGEDLKIVSPLEFIPILEKTGYIVQVEKWVLKTVIKNLENWLPTMDNKDFIVNINASSETLKSTGFKEAFCETIKASKISPKNIILEITEGTLILNIDYILEILKYIKEFGVRVAIDDFGTGYSSLGYLKSLPVDEIKVDRIFVKNIENSKSDLDFVESIISLIHSLGHFACVEGVESEKQKDMINNFNVKFIQGFYYNKPLPSNEFESIYIN